MKNIQDYDTTLLLDLLAQHTEQYTKMLRSNSRTGGFMDCERTVILIQYELAARKQLIERP
jgi:hypothetical protein